MLFVILKLILNNMVLDELSVIEDSNPKELVKKVHNCDIDSLHALLNSDYDINLPEDKLLITAIKNGHTDIVKLLVERGAPFISDDHNPLFVAIENNHLNIVEYLIEKGAPITSDYPNPLFVAIKNNRLNIVKFLAAKGAPIVPANFYCDPSRVAIRNNNFDMVKFSLDNGASLNPTNEYCNPFIDAIRSNSLDMMKFMVEKGAHKHINYEDLIQVANSDIFKFLFETLFERVGWCYLEMLIEINYKRWQCNIKHYPHRTSQYTNIINYILEFWIKDRKYDLVIKHNEYMGFDNHLTRLFYKMIEGNKPFFNKRKMFSYDCFINVL